MRLLCICLKYINKVTDNFETDNGWTVGVNTDKATQAVWARNVITTPTNYMLYYFPSLDYSNKSSSCFVTRQKYKY